RGWGGGVGGLGRRGSGRSPARARPASGCWPRACSRKRRTRRWCGWRRRSSSRRKSSTGRSTASPRSCTSSTAAGATRTRLDWRGTKTMLHNPGARILMCRPEHFAVSYAINPWMDPQSWARDALAHAAAAREWDGLHRKLLALGAAIELVAPAAGLPDLVFTANAAVVLDRQVLLARFRHPERQREEAHFEAAFRSLQAHGLVDAVRKLPDGLVLEGAGDCVWDATRQLFWLGYGPRSDATAQRAVA